MLARAAQSLYWMSRYLERAEHLSRLLRLQTEPLVDRPIAEIHFGWSRVYDSVGGEPPLGGFVLLDSDYNTLADSYTLADDLTFERSNPSSVWSCLVAGRENARQVRQSISAEVWTSLNLTYLRVQDLAIEAIWGTAPETFYAETTAAIGPGPDAGSQQEMIRLADRVSSSVRSGWSGGEDPENLLRQAQDGCHSIHDLITSCYFDYTVD